MSDKIIDFHLLLNYKNKFIYFNNGKNNNNLIYAGEPMK